jgi:hypothetical protein
VALLSSFACSSLGDPFPADFNPLSERLPRRRESTWWTFSLGIGLATKELGHLPAAERPVTTEPLYQPI